MQITSIKTFIPAITLGIASLASCTDPFPAARRYMANKPNMEYQEVINSGNIAMTQSKLDSVAYKDLFLTTKQGKDINNVVEYNKIASSVRGYEPFETNYSDIKEDIRKSASKAGLPTRKYESLENFWVTAWGAQHEVDQWAYGKFFENLGLMKDKSFVQKFDKVVSQTTPKIL